ncbi:MAG: hypothetical protein SNI70_11405 [Rikenellaceae bacterium]
MKIEHVIDSCKHCRFLKRYNDATANHGYVLICIKSVKVVHIDYSRGHSHDIGCTIDIPQDCTLEDYVGDKTQVDEE